MTDEEANISKVQYLYGSHGSTHDGHKRESRCALPGEICQSAERLLRSRGCGMDRQKSAAAILRYLDRTEGPNVNEGQES